MKKHYSKTVIAGLALFSMFFGGGNVIFPVLLGEFAGSRLTSATLGFLLASCILPLIGLFAIILYRCDTKAFFSRIGRGPGVVVYGLLVLLLGPLGATPRLLIVSYATLKPYLFDLSFPLFAAACCLIIALFVLKKNKVLNILGAVLTPLLLLSLGIIIALGVTAPHGILTTSHSSREVFFEGLDLGYALLDLFAGLLYGSLVLNYLEDKKKGGEGGDRVLIRNTLRASLLAMVLLSVVYIGLILVGAFHADALGGEVPREEAIRAVSLKLLGPAGGVIACFAVALACLTTVISQVIVCTTFVRENLFKERGGELAALGATLACALCISCLGFTGIAKILEPLLRISYPAIIVLCVANISYKLYNLRPIKVPFVATLLVTILGYSL